MKNIHFFLKKKCLGLLSLSTFENRWKLGHQCPESSKRAIIRCHCGISIYAPRPLPFMPDHHSCKTEWLDRAGCYYLVHRAHQGAGETAGWRKQRQLIKRCEYHAKFRLKATDMERCRWNTEKGVKLSSLGGYWAAGKKGKGRNKDKIQISDLEN